MSSEGNPLAGLHVGQALRFMEARYGPRTALVNGADRFTFSELAREARATARWLRDGGCRPGEKVALFLPDGPTLLFHWLGAMCAGCVAIILNTRLRSEELAYQLAQSGCPTVVTSATASRASAWLGTVLGVSSMGGIGEGPFAAGGFPSLRRVLAAVERPSALVPSEATRPGLGGSDPGLDPDSVCMLIYSSGTTGPPKGVLIKHVVWRKAWDSGARLGLTAEDALYLGIPLFGSMATLNGVLPFWAHGAKVALDEKFDEHRCVWLMRTEGCTALHLLPSIVRRLVDAQEAAASGGSLARIGMALTTDPEVLELAERRLGIQHIVSGYGLTETSALITRHPPDASRGDRLANQGPPLPGIEIRIDPDGLEDRGPGAGEIQVRGYCVTPGYHDMPEHTRRLFTADGWLRTGDLGRIEGGDRLVFLGRIGESFKSKGFLVSPSEVEAALLRHPDVAEAAVVGTPDTIDGAVGVAFVVCRPDRHPASEELRSHLQPLLSGYKLPRRIQVLDALPRTPGTSKVQRYRLKELAARLLGR